MRKYLNEYGKEVYADVTLDTPISNGHFVEVDCCDYEDEQFALHTNLGSITVLDRMTGFGWRDVETGYRDMDGKFWLSSGNMDVRDHGCKTFGEMVDWVKNNANNCVGV